MIKTICRTGFKNENSVFTCVFDAIRLKNEDYEASNITTSGLKSDNQ